MPSYPLQVLSHFLQVALRADLYKTPLLVPVVRLASLRRRQALSSSSEYIDITAGSIYNASADSLIDLRDGSVYKTVTIGDQIWMAENLNFKYNYNTAISMCYDNYAKNCVSYGRLYTWSAAMDSAGVIR